MPLILTDSAGSYYDVYIFQAEAGKAYEITVKSDTFSAWVHISFSNAAYILQAAYVDRPGAQVQFSGILEQPGQYDIVVSSSEAAVLGSYTLTLSEGQPPEPPAAWTTAAWTTAAWQPWRPAECRWSCNIHMRYSVMPGRGGVLEQM